MPPTIKEVAELAGVSAGTVSNVLNRPEVVSEDTRRRVLGAIEELGFVRNGSARDLRVGRSRTIGFVVLDVGNPYFTDVARGADGVVEQNASVLTLLEIGDDVDRQRRHLDNLEEQRVQGVLITPVDEEDPRLDELVARGVPVVLVDRRSPDGRRCSVAVDDVLGGRMAAEHLLERGHTRLGFIGGPRRLRQVAERLQGASEVVGGADRMVLVERPGLTLADGREAGEHLAGLRAGSRPTAVFCANDLLAIGVLQALTTAGLRVPEDMAIIGYDDIAYAAAAAVPLSSIRQPREALGATAAQLLFEEIRAGGSGHHHRQVVFQPELVVRASSGLRRG